MESRVLEATVHSIQGITVVSSHDLHADSVAPVSDITLNELPMHMNGSKKRFLT